jgi:hypothetical protein
MFKPFLIAALLAACASATGAQTSTATTSTAAQPLDARAEVPLARMLSPLENYRRHTSVEIQPGSWRAANDNVNRIGGWRTYAREAQAATPSSGASGPAAAAAPAHAASAPGLPVPRPAPTAPAHRH